MYKSLWARVLACLSVVVVLSLSVLPLIANGESYLSGDRWATESNIFTPFYTLSTSLEDTLSAEIVDTFTEAVTYAYDGGMFGGGVPIAIGSIPQYDRINSQYLWTPAVIVAYMPYTADPDQNAASGSPGKNDIKNWLKMSVVLSGGAYRANFSNEYNWSFTSFVYVMADSGDFIPYTNFSFSQNNNPGNYMQFSVSQNTTNADPPQTQFHFWAFRSVNVSLFGTDTNMETAEAPKTSFSWFYNDNSATAQSIFGIGNSNQWVAPAPANGGNIALLSFLENCLHKYVVNSSVHDDGYEEGLDDGYAEGREQGFQSGYDEGYDAGFDPGYRQGYDDGYAEGEAQAQPVTLDIPRIFTALFRATHDILGGFDISIFGISIVGILVAVIVITVVSFLIKKLLK